MGPADDQRVSIVEGPPGTGKTCAIERVLKFCIDQNLPFLVIAASDNAVNINAERLLQNLKRAGLSPYLHSKVWVRC